MPKDEELREQYEEAKANIKTEIRLARRGNYYDAQVATREAWKRSTGKYPMDDRALEVWQREADRHLQTILNQASEIDKLRVVAQKALTVSMLAEYGELFGLGVDGPYVIDRNVMLALGSALEAAGIEPD